MARLFLAAGRHRRALAALILSAGALFLVHEVQVRETAAPGRARVLRDPARPGEAPAPRAASVRPVFAPAGGGPPIEMILGRVTGPDGAPVAGATAQLEGRSAFTGSDGRFRLPRASGRVKVTHPDHFPREIDAASFPSRLARPREEAAPDAGPPDGSLPTNHPGPGPLDVVLAPGARVHGVVLGAGGSPLPGAKVHFGAADAPLEVVTDSRGAYESPLLPPGALPIFVSHPEHQPRGGTATLLAGSFRTRFDVRLRGGARIAVRAASREGEPVPDAEVWIRLERRGGPAAGPGRPAAGEGAGPLEGTAARALEEWMFLGRTGDLGALEARREPGSEARIRIVAAGFREEIRRVEGSEVSFTLAPAPALRGHAVHAATGLPMPLRGVRLEVLAPAGFEEAPDRGRLFRSLAPGKFVVGLPPYPGVYRVAATGERGFRGASAGLAFDGREAPGPVIVRLEERHEIRGAVRGPDGPAGGAAVELVEEEPSGRRLERLLGAIVPAPHRVALAGSTGPDGRFQFGDVPPGTYRIRARKAGLAEHLSPPFSLPWEGEYLVPLRRAASLDGTLLGAAGAPEAGAPEAGAPLLLTRGDDPARVAWTDAAGGYAFEGLPPGTYRLRIGDPSRARAEPADLEEVPLGGEASPGAPAQEERAWDLEIEEGARVTFDPRGPSPGAETLAAPAAPAPPPAPRPEEPEIAADRSAAAGVEDATQRARFDIIDAVTSEPFGGVCEVELTRRDGAPPAARIARSGTTPIEIDGLAAGRYVVRVRAGGLLHREEEITVPGRSAWTVPIDRGDDLTFQLLVADGVEFRGRAEVVLWKAGREVYRAVEQIGGSVTVPTAGPGDYELLVHSEDRRAHVTFTVAREAVEKGPATGDN